MQIALIDLPTTWANLQPITLTRPVSHIRVGIFTIVEKWANYTQTLPACLTAQYLQPKYTLPTPAGKDVCCIHSATLPTHALWVALQELGAGKVLVDAQGTFLAYRTTEPVIASDIEEITAKITEKIVFEGDFIQINSLTDIFAHNGAEIQADLKWIKTQRTSAPLEDKHTIIYNPENVFIEEGASIKASILDASKGVIYIGKNAEVQAGTIIQGNFALCEGAVINVGGKMRPDTTIGVYCKVGGEISNSVLIGYSNKAHDGFLGNSVLGEWCNLGADTNTSNLKNNYSSIRIWNYPAQDYTDTHRQFCGLMMGDHSKAGINTMFNTGTVVGVSTNVFGGDFPPKYIPSFAWGAGKGSTKFELDKALEVAALVMERRKKSLTEVDKAILAYLHERGV